MKTYILISAALWACLSCSTPNKEQQTEAATADPALPTGAVMRLVSFDPQQIRNVGIEVGRPVHVNVGRYTAPTDMLFELVDPKDIHLALNVFEKDLNALSVGQRVTAYANADRSKKFTAKVILIGKSLTDDRMTEVHCHFDPGMFMNGEVSLEGKKGPCGAGRCSRSLGEQVVCVR